MEAKSSQSKFFYKITPERLKQYKQKAVYFSKPRLVAYYDHNYRNVTNSKRIQYFRKPVSDQYPIDLNGDLETFVRRDRALYSIGIDISCKYDMSNSHIAENGEQTKVITRRGTLARIMESYYMKKWYDTLRVFVTRYNNNLYMVREEFDDSANEWKPVHTHHDRFEKMLFTDSPNGPPKTNEACDQNVFLVGVHRSNFGKYDVIYSGDIQGIIDDEEITEFDDLDDLTNRRFVFTKQMWTKLKNNDNKYLTIWLQSYLANVKDIYIGYKNGEGIIHEPIEHTLSKDLFQNRFWNPTVCTGFLYDFLQNVEQRMSSVNCPNTVYVFQYNQESNFFTYEVFNGKTDKSFITQEYIKFFEEHI